MEIIDYSLLCDESIIDNVTLKFEFGMLDYEIVKLRVEAARIYAILEEEPEDELALELAIFSNAPPAKMPTTPSKLEVL